MSFFDDLDNMFKDLGEKLVEKFENLPEDHFIKKTAHQLQNKANQLIQKFEKLPEDSFVKRTFQQSNQQSRDNMMRIMHPLEYAAQRKKLMLPLQNHTQSINPVLTKIRDKRQK